MDEKPVEGRITSFLFQRADALGIPFSGTFELTPLCNMNCKMCYVRLSPEEQAARGPLRSAEDWLALGKEAAEAGMTYLLLTGGEPTVHPEFDKILEGLSPLGLLMSINTNGTLITKERAAHLRRCGLMRANVSLYGVSRESYGALCGAEELYDRAVAGIEHLLEAGIGVKISYSLTPHNAEQLPLVAEFAQKKGLVLQVASYLFPPLRRNEEASGQADRFPPEVAAYYNAYADLLTLGKERFLSFEGKSFSVPEEGDCTGTPDSLRCRAGKSAFWVTWQGLMTPCGMFPDKYGVPVMDEPFLPAWEQLKKEAAAIRLPAKCSACESRESCRACAAMVLTESGCFDKAPEYRCRMMASYEAGWKLVKERFL